MYFEIRKRIDERNLSLSDIQDVLSQKDDEDQFMYTLADKLGYLGDGKHDNPHILVIKSHKEKLITLLETKKAGFSTSLPQEKLNQDSAISDEPPVSDEPASDGDRGKIGYEVSMAIRGLGSDAIYDLLNSPFFSISFGYTVGIQLGYSDDDEHMKYLESVNITELKQLLQWTLKLKTSSEKTPASDDQGTEGQGQQSLRGLDSIQHEPTLRRKDTRKEEKIESENKDTEEEYQEEFEHDLDIGDFDDPTGINQRLVSLMMNNEFMDYLLNTHVDLYDELVAEDVSQDAVNEATEEYSKWMAMPEQVNKPEKVANAEKGGELETPRQKTSDEAKAEDRAEDNSNSLEDLYQHGYAADDYWKVPAYPHRYPSGVHLQDYIMLCLLISIAVGVGYLCSCTNRKVSHDKLYM